MIFGDADAPITVERVTLGSYQLTRVAADDPAVRDAIDPAWRMTEVLVLHPIGDAAPWEQRVAKEFAGEVGGTARPVTLACAPTPLPLPRSLPRSPAPAPTVEPDVLTSAALAAPPPGAVARATVDHAVDEVRDRFGFDAIRLGATDGDERWLEAPRPR